MSDDLGDRNFCFSDRFGLADIAFSGIGNLRKLDAAISVSQKENEIELFYDGKAVAATLPSALEWIWK